MPECKKIKNVQIYITKNSPLLHVYEIPDVGLLKIYVKNCD